MNQPADTLLKSQLDSPERKLLEKKVCQMREKAENDLGYRIRDYYGLEDVGHKETGQEEKSPPPDYLDTDELETREKLIEAVRREQGDKHGWEKALTLYVKGCGYTLVNRLAAFRCMEVRGFIERDVTRFRDDGKTPAADPVIRQNFLDKKEGVAEAYRQACRQMADEIEILFDPDSPYSLLEDDLDDALFDTFEALCRLLDEVDDQTWRADDVLGWVYEYYNVDQLDSMDVNKLTTVDEVSVANQFYTPHWVVRMLTDNSLGKLYLEHRGSLAETIQKQEELFTPEGRKARGTSPTEAPTIAELCTYLVPTDEAGEATDTLLEGGPEELRVLDPACGSGHFLLYAFDILERIWWQERPNLDRTKVPAKILEHNLFGVDLDVRACQLAAFNLYLKARARAEAEGAEGEDAFHMPPVGIVCADIHLANLEGADEVFDDVAGGNERVRTILEDVLDAFESIEGLGSLLDVKGTLTEGFFQEKEDLPLFSDKRDVHDILESLHLEVQRHRDGDSFKAQDLKSFLRLLVVLSQDYDVALMNPPYGAGGRMPRAVQEYVGEHYEYARQYYINFFEVGERLAKKNGRVGMLVPWSFMFKKSFADFRKAFISSGEGSFDFLAEFGYGILDNATVSTVGTVVRSGDGRSSFGTFMRLSDVSKSEKEGAFLGVSFGSGKGRERRFYQRKLSEFEMIPGAPLSYWVPRKIREIFDSQTVFDADNGEMTGRQSLGAVKAGITTGENRRFLRYHWEAVNFRDWIPFAKGGEDAWMVTPVTRVIDWRDDGNLVKRYEGSYPRNQDYYFRRALTYTYLKRGGRRFSLFVEGGLFGHAGKTFFPSGVDVWSVLAYSNSWLFSYLMLSQTSERHWEVGKVSNIPWDPKLVEYPALKEATKGIVGNLLTLRHSRTTSPHHQAPWLLRVYNYDSCRVLVPHPHHKLADEVDLPQPPSVGLGTRFSEAVAEIFRFRASCRNRIASFSQQIEEVIFKHFGITAEERDEIYDEIAYRTIDDPREEIRDDSEAVLASPEDFSPLVKRMLLHLVLEIMSTDKDGVVPLATQSEEGEEDLLSRLETKYEEIFGEHAEARLEETDQILGRKTSSREAYPNLRRWLTHDLFDFHLSQFENTPILWKLTTKRLVSDATGEGFACLVDYHQMDHNLFTTIRNRYLEKREKALRDKLTTARQRVSSAGLSAKERDRWEKEQARCESGLRQIQAFRDAMSELKRSRPRDWSDENRQLAENLVGLVGEFRERTAERLEMLDAVHREMPEKDFVDHFSPKFMESVNGNREEWIDALEDLEEACQAYAATNDEPVEAHLYDLLVYFDDLAGSTHYASNGILFMNYYFKKGEKYRRSAGELESEQEPHEELLAELARETERDVELGEQIRDACKTLSKQLPSDWKTRALEEVMVAGWEPVKKHGVAINIEPLAEAEIVPESVDKKVL